MTIDALSATNAYRNQMKLVEGAGDTTSQEGAAPSPFEQLVENALGDAVKAGQKSETLQTQSIASGKGELTDIVTAVANAELSLNAVVAIRDRVINAYNDIIKMSI